MENRDKTQPERATVERTEAATNEGRETRPLNRHDRRAKGKLDRQIADLDRKIAAAEAKGEN